MLDVDFVIKFGEWIEQNEYDVVRIFCYFSFYAFVVIWVGSIVYRNIPEEEEEEDEQDEQNNDVSDKDER